MRSKKAFTNSVTSLAYEAVVIVSGLIIPRLILTHYGSEYNGVIASITQFISYIGLLTAGVGVVTQTALYKPLAEHDLPKISGIMYATEIFIRKVAFIFAGAILAFAWLYSFLVRNEFDPFFIFSLTLILGVRIFIYYLFGFAYQMLITADQRAYVIVRIRICTVTLNTVIAAILILAGSELLIAQLAAAPILAAVPMFVRWYARKHYQLVFPIEPDNSAIRERWDAFTSQVAYFVNNNTDIIIITLFLGVIEVSVYVVYFMVIRAMRTIILGLMGNEMAAPFGNMLARGEYGIVRKNLLLYEFMAGSISVVLCTCTAVLIVPFVSVYTQGIVDANYFRPMFAHLICAAQFLFVLRIPYQALTKAVGHFRQMRNGAIAEMCINILLSIVLVQRFGISGVAIGTLCSMMFRTLQYAAYVSRHIVRRSLWIAARTMLLSFGNAAVTLGIVCLLPEMGAVTYTAWTLHALSVFAVAVAVTGLFTVLFYRDEALMLMGKMRYLRRK